MVPPGPSAPEDKDDQVNDESGLFHPSDSPSERGAAKRVCDGFPRWFAQVNGVWVPTGVDTNSTQFPAAALGLRRARATQRAIEHKVNKRTGRTRPSA
jgi:hypothetical protein